MYFAYLIPIKFTSNGKVTMEYLLEIHKKDMRTRFCKIHKNHLIYSITDIQKLPTYHKMQMKEDGRLIAPDGDTARMFQTELETILPYGYKAVRQV